MMMQGLVGQTLSLELLFLDYYSLLPLYFPLPSATRAGFLREVPGDCFRLFFMMLRRFPADTAPATWEYVHPAFPHLPKYIKSMHCPRLPMPTSDIRSFWERMRVYKSTPGFRSRKSDIMDTISGIRVGFIHFPPTIAGATLGTATAPVSVNIIDVDPALLRLPLFPPALLVRDMIAANPADRPNNKSTGQLIVIFSEQLVRRQLRSAKSCESGKPGPV
jgi:hypothetical protein